MVNGTTDYKLGKLTSAVETLHEEVIAMRKEVKEIKATTTENKINLIKVAAVAIVSGAGGSAVFNSIL